MVKFNEEEFLNQLHKANEVRSRDYVRTSWPKKERQAVIIKPQGTVNEKTTDFYDGLHEYLTGFYPGQPGKVNAIIEQFRMEYATILCKMSKEDIEDLQKQIRLTC